MRGREKTRESDRWEEGRNNTKPCHGEEGRRERKKRKYRRKEEERHIN